MLEAALFIGIAWLILRTETWRQPWAPTLTTNINFRVLLGSLFDEGPLRLQDDEPVQEDANSNPHYIWYEQSQ